MNGWIFIKPTCMIDIVKKDKLTKKQGRKVKCRGQICNFEEKHC